MLERWIGFEGDEVAGLSGLDTGAGLPELGRVVDRWSHDERLTTALVVPGPLCLLASVVILVHLVSDIVNGRAIASWQFWGIAGALVGLLGFALMIVLLSTRVAAYEGGLVIQRLWGFRALRWEAIREVRHRGISIAGFGSRRVRIVFVHGEAVTVMGIRRMDDFCDLLDAMTGGRRPDVPARPQKA